MKQQIKKKIMVIKFLITKSTSEVKPDLDKCSFRNKSDGDSLALALIAFSDFFYQLPEILMRPAGPTQGLF